MLARKLIEAVQMVADKFDDNGQAIDEVEPEMASVEPEVTEEPKIEEGLINGGFFVFQNKIFDYLNSNENCDFEVGPLEKLTQEGQLMVYQHNGNWACMDTHRDSVSLNNLWKNDQAFWQA